MTVRETTSPGLISALRNNGTAANSTSSAAKEIEGNNPPASKAKINATRAQIDGISKVLMRWVI